MSAVQSVERSRARILVADGSGARLESVLAPLATVVVAYNGQRALELLRAEPFDVVVADTTSDVDGFAMLGMTLMLEHPPHVILLMSGAQQGSRAFDCMRKPVDTRHLEIVVRRALADRAAPSCDLASLTYREAVERVRTDGVRRYLQALLERFAGNVTIAADHADVERESFHRLCRRYGVLPTEFRGDRV